MEWRGSLKRGMLAGLTGDRGQACSPRVITSHLPSCNDRGRRDRRREKKRETKEIKVGREGKKETEREEEAEGKGSCNERKRESEREG